MNVKIEQSMDEMQMIGALLTILIGLVAWVGQRLHAKIDALEDTVQRMAVQNAKDHGEVSERITALETTIENLPHPWRPTKTHT